MATRSQLLVSATVPTGLEQWAADECQEVVGKRPSYSRGSITIALDSLQQLQLVDKLRSVDNFQVIVAQLPSFCNEPLTVLERLECLPQDESIDWWTPLAAWQYYQELVKGSSGGGGGGGEGHEGVEVDAGSETELSGIVPPTAIDTSSSSSSSTVFPEQFRDVSFRVTCTRTGKHSFKSMEAAGSLGAGVIRHFGWRVDLKNSDIEILLCISGEAVTLGVALTRVAKFKRNISCFGPTTLRATIAYGLLRMASVKRGDIVMDPMCGGGSISIEGALAFPSTYHLAGDIHELACDSAAKNASALSSCGGVSVVRWNARVLPIRAASVDVIVSDMPFGKKMGHRADNWGLYTAALLEFGRVCVPTTGRAVLLTHDTKAIHAAIKFNTLWRRVRTHWINLGGLKVGAYLLHRTSASS